MKKIFFYVFGLLGTAASSFAQLSPGDIAIIQVNNATDAFTWVALKDINVTTPVTWTDSSWGATGADPNTAGWRTTENSNTSTFTNTLPTTISAGTIGTVVVSGGGFGNGGEQIFLFTYDTTNFTGTTTAAQANLVFGVNWDNSGWLTTGAYATDKSYLPSTLVGYSVALGIGDNWYYNGSTTGTSASLLASITNSANWTTDSNTTHQWSDSRPSIASFTITAVPESSAYGIAIACFLGLLLWARNRRSRA